MREPVDIIIPTMDNLGQLVKCVNSMMSYAVEYPINIIVVNNGELAIETELPTNVKILCPGKNLGWTGGLREGLKHSKSKYVCFANDDIFIPRSSSRWLKHIVRDMEWLTALGAVGPASNMVMGTQNIWHETPYNIIFTSFLIGFCMVVRREALDKSGGVHDMEYGGDDIDLSIRLRQQGYKLMVNREVFVYHHGFQTGERVYGKPNIPGGWNSPQMTENVNMELIRKHGFMEFWHTILNHENADLTSGPVLDAESEMVKQHVNGGITLELGCGNKKTVPHAIGIDIIPTGEEVPYMGCKSVADIVADVSEKIPLPDDYADCIIARHVLEHCVDHVKALKEWSRILKPGGKMVISCPNEKVCDGVPLNPQHVHAFTPESIATVTDLLGLKPIASSEFYNFNSFTVCVEK